MKIVSRLMRTGLRRGLFEGSQGWLYVGVAAVVLRVMRRVLVQPAETIYSTELKPGQGIEIRTHRPGA